MYATLYLMYYKQFNTIQYNIIKYNKMKKLKQYNEI